MAESEFGRNLVDTFQARSGRGEAPSSGPSARCTYRPQSWREVAGRVRSWAARLVQLGLGPATGSSIVAENRPEWCIADLAILTAGGITVPTYTTNTTEDHAYLLQPQRGAGVICAGKAVLQRPAGPAPGAGGPLRHPMEPVEQAGEFPVKLLHWEEALARGRDAAPVDHAPSLRPDDLACFIYTSGTGGRPRASSLATATSWPTCTACRCSSPAWSCGHEVFLSFLPLSHSYEHTAGQFLPIALRAGSTTPRAWRRCLSNLAEVRPTIVTCVPRLFEVLRQRIMRGVEREGGLKARLFHKALKLGASATRRPAAAASGTGRLRAGAPRVRKVQERFGGRLKALISGGAPLSYGGGLFFVALGLPLLQGYGQTEGSPVVCVNPPLQNKINTVAAARRGRAASAEDGEILVRGDLVMRGYWKDEATAAVLARRLAAHRRHRLARRGRLSEDHRPEEGSDRQFRWRQHRPSEVEGLLLLEPEIGQALVYGDHRPNLVALIVPHADFVRKFARGTSVSRTWRSWPRTRRSRRRSARPWRGPTTAVRH